MMLVELFPLSNVFLSLDLISEWDEAIITCQMLTVAIVLPFGISTGDFRVRVFEDGDVLEFSVTCFRTLVDTELMNLNGLNAMLRERQSVPRSLVSTPKLGFSEETTYDLQTF